ncbi:hypothetical protein J6590_031705, partial [Homalodisca vitripennis]
MHLISYHLQQNNRHLGAVILGAIRRYCATIHGSVSVTAPLGLFQRGLGGRIQPCRSSRFRRSAITVLYSRASSEHHKARRDEIDN